MLLSAHPDISCCFPLFSKIEDANVATIGVPGQAVDPLLVSPRGAGDFSPRPELESFDVRPFLDKLNDATPLQSSIYGETWSDRLQRSFVDNDAVKSAFKNSRVTQEYAMTDYAQKLKAVLTMMGSRKDRGADRDVFYVSMGAWDHHDVSAASVAIRSILEYVL